MRLQIIQRETVTKSLIIDTEDFTSRLDNRDMEVFEIAELINNIKEDPAKYFLHDMHCVEEEREIQSIRVETA